MRIVWGVVIGSLIFHGSLSATQLKAGPKRKTNLIYICTDDQGRWSLGAYGNKESKTPNMDRLAREGALFKNAFCATPVCSPSRVSFMTGKWGHQVGITDWINPKEAVNQRVGIPNTAMTWMQVLQNHGYSTGLIGKWHLGMLPEFHPTKHGFHHFFGFLGGGNTPMNPTLERAGKEEKLKGSLPDLLVDDALAFVRSNKDRPFALMLNFRAPHLPYGPVPEVDSAPFQQLDPTIPQHPGLDIKAVKQFTRAYYGSIHSVDRNLGRLLQLLDELGLTEDTIVVFTSDHGYMLGHHGLHTKGNATYIVTGDQRGKQRPNMFDHSLQVPLLIRWPRSIRRGAEVREFVSNIDAFPSMLGLLDIPEPKDYKHHGKNFAPLVNDRDDTAIAWKNTIFAQYDLHNAGKASMRTIRNERWHLVRQYLGNQPDELFDLQNDPEELTNLFASPEHQATRVRLQTELDAWMRSIDDPRAPK